MKQQNVGLSVKTIQPKTRQLNLATYITSIQLLLMKLSDFHQSLLNYYLLQHNNAWDGVNIPVEHRHVCFCNAIENKSIGAV